MHSDRLSSPPLGEAHGNPQVSVSTYGVSFTLCAKKKPCLTQQMSFRINAPREIVFSQDEASNQSKDLKDRDSFTTPLSEVASFYRIAFYWEFRRSLTQPLPFLLGNSKFFLPGKMTRGTNFKEFPHLETGVQPLHISLGSSQTQCNLGVRRKMSGGESQHVHSRL